MTGTCYRKKGPLIVLAICAVLSTVMQACASTREPGKPLRTAFEQLLLSQAMDKTLRGVSLPVPERSSVFVETTGLTRDSVLDQEFVRQALMLQLAREGFRLVYREEEATYSIRVLIQTFGTEQGIVFIGLPPVQSILIPFALPEISLYKDLHQTGFVRWSYTLFERATGRMINTSPWYQATTYYNHYTVLLVVSFHLTDLELPK